MSNNRVNRNRGSFSNGFLHINYNFVYPALEPWWPCRL
jgi:hypothetical protein